MTEEMFQNQIREYRYREPFQPFVLEFEDGHVLEIDNGMAIVFNGTHGGFLSPDYQLLEFNCNEIRTIRLLVPETRP